MYKLYICYAYCVFAYPDVYKCIFILFHFSNYSPKIIPII